MPQPVAGSDPAQLELMKAVLEQRGLLATGGNIRSIPFSGDVPASSPDSDVSANGSIPSANGAGAARPPGATPLVQGNQLVDPTTKQPIEGSLADDWWKYLLAGAGVAGGVGLASILRRRKGGAPEVGVEDIPTVEGETIDPLAPAARPEHIVNGEFDEVRPTAHVGNTKFLEAPSGDKIMADSAANILAARNKQIEARNMPRANPTAQSDTSVVRLPDAANDIDPQEIENAKALVQQLIQNRTKGNAAARSQSRFSRRAVQPTGPTDKNAEDGLLNTIIRLMREQGATRIIPKGI
jgi:hypothetical protein